METCGNICCVTSGAVSAQRNGCLALRLVVAQFFVLQSPHSMLEHTTTNRTVIYFHPSASLCQVPFSFLPTSRQLHVWRRNFQTNQLLLLKQHKAPLVVLFLMTEKQKCPKINGIPSRSFGSMWMNDGRKNRCH